MAVPTELLMQTVLCKLLLGKVKAIQGRKIINKTSIDSSGDLGILTYGKYVVLVITTGGSIIYEILRNGTPVTDLLSLNGKVVSLLDPVPVLCTSYLVRGLRLISHLIPSVLAGPPVTNDDLHTTKVDGVTISILDNRKQANLFLAGAGSNLAGALARLALAAGRLLAGSLSLAATSCHSNSHCCCKRNSHKFLKHLSFHFFPPYFYIDLT